MKGVTELQTALGIEFNEKLVEITHNYIDKTGLNYNLLSVIFAKAQEAMDLAADAIDQPKLYERKEVVQVTEAQEALGVEFAKRNAETVKVLKAKGMELNQTAFLYEVTSKVFNRAAEADDQPQFTRNTLSNEQTN